MRRIVIPESSDTFQRQRRLGLPIRTVEAQTSWQPRLTRYNKFTLVRGPIIIEELLKVDRFAHLSDLFPNEKTAADLDLGADVGYRRNLPTHVHHQGVYGTRKQGTYRRWTGIQVQSSSLSNSLPCFSTNNLSIYW